MLRDLFPRDHAKYVDSRFGGELESFARWLEENGHLRHPLRLHLRRAKYVLERSKEIDPGPLFNEERLRQAFIIAGPDAYLHLCTGRIFIRFLAATNRLSRVELVDTLSL